VRWNGEDRATTFIDSGALSALISDADIANPGTATITVIDNAPGGGVSESRIFTISQYASEYFPQVAVDAGYSTIFTILNVGTDGDSGFLTLTDQTGNPLIVTCTRSGAAPETGSSFPISIPAGGIDILTLSAPGTPTAIPKVGWGRIDSTGGLLTGVGAFQTRQGSLLTSIAGVLPAQLDTYVTIPVDNDAAVGRRTGFAVANPGPNTVHLQILVIDRNGNQVGNPIPLTLGPRQHLARFLDEFSTQVATFAGSMNILGEGVADEFVAIALLINPGPTSQGLMSVIPVIRGASLTESRPSIK